MFVDFVVVVAVVVNVVVVALFVVADHIIFSWSINVNLRLLKAAVEFLWWWVGWVVQSHFCVQPNYSVEVVLCCVVVGVVTKIHFKSHVHLAL